MPEESQRRLNRAYLEFGVLSATLVVLLAIGIGAWLLWLEPPTIRYLNLPFPMRERTLHPGDVALFRVMRCVQSEDELPFLTTLTIINAKTGWSTRIAATGAALPPGCSEDDSGLATLPQGLESGSYYIAGITLAPGRLRPRYVRWRTEEFEVAR